SCGLPRVVGDGIKWRVSGGGLGDIGLRRWWGWGWWGEPWECYGSMTSWRSPLLLLLTMLLPAMISANGKYVTAYVVGGDPEIPVQRAAIRFEDGVQTLVVESTFVAEEAAEVAWILPLPAEPTEINVESPGLIETMAFQFGPGVRRQIRGESMVIYAIAFVILM